MNKLNFLSQCAIAGIAGMIGTVGVQTNVQAGTISASSNVQFTDVTLQLIDNDGSGDGIGNLLLPSGDYDGAFAQVNASGAINGIDPVDAVGPVACGTTPITTTGAGSEFPFSLGGGTIDAGASVDCNSVPGSASNFAEIELTGDNISGNAEGTYEVFSANFNATPDDVVDLEGFFEGDLFAQVTGYTGGTKLASSEFLAQYTINLIQGDGNAIEVFAGEVFQAGISVINENDTETLNTGIIDIGFNDYVIGSSGLDPDGGTYEFRLAAVEEVNGTIDRVAVPEPGTVVGLLAIGGLGLGLKRKKQS